MDIRAFSEFLREDLSKSLQAVENNLVTAAYEKAEHTHRAAGSREVLKALVDQMPSLVDAFYKKQEEAR